MHVVNQGFQRKKLHDELEFCKLTSGVICKIISPKSSELLILRFCDPCSSFDCCFRCRFAQCDFHMRNILDDVHRSLPILFSRAAACISASRCSINETGTQKELEFCTFDDWIFIQSKVFDSEHAILCDSSFVPISGEERSEILFEYVSGRGNKLTRSGEVRHDFFLKKKN